MRETSLDDFIGEGGAGDGDSDGDGASGGSDDHGDDSGEDVDEEPGAVEERDGGEAVAEGEPETDAETGTETEAEAGAEAETADVTGDEPDEELAVEPATSTYDWTPTGADCQACGAAVEQRWRDDGELVCADCKAW